MGAIVIIYLVAAALVWIGASAGAKVAEIPVFACCALLIFALQWLAFIPAYRQQTEKFYDLVGSLTFICSVLLALILSGVDDARSLLLVSLVLIWAVRLGMFLFIRIAQDGSDSRFDRIKPDPVLFFRTWSLQGLWVLITSGAAIAAISSAQGRPLGWWDALGSGLWLLGFIVEVLADAQKRRFRKTEGANVFITHGLWARSRHPNYFGEILLWLGIALIALPALQGWQYLTLVSPMFVWLLLTRVSGIPLLERKADKRWADDPAYLAYKEQTPVLVPRMF